MPIFHQLVLYFLFTAKRACSNFVSLLCFRTTTWPKYSVSMFMDMAVLNTVHSVLWIPFQYELILGHSKNMWEWFASVDPHCLQHVRLLICFSWCGVLKNLTMFFKQCSLHFIELLSQRTQILLLGWLQIPIPSIQPYTHCCTKTARD